MVGRIGMGRRRRRRRGRIQRPLRVAVVSGSTWQTPFQGVDLSWTPA